MIEGQIAIRNAYRDDQVAREYIHRRFREPLGALLHARQVACVRDLIRRRRAVDVLEIAPGPARLTVDVAPSLPQGGTLMDASAQMLEQARRRMEAAGARWRFVQGDAFALPFGAGFDLVYAFRFIRHFETADRCRTYREIHRVLKPGGVLVFDAVNAAVAAPLRARAGAGEYRHYDALLDAAGLSRELADAGFSDVRLSGVQRRYPALARIQVLVAPRSRTLARMLMEAVDRAGGGAPLEWIVTCTRA